jgi:hypothetical protein
MPTVKIAMRRVRHAFHVDNCAAFLAYSAEMGKPKLGRPPSDNPTAARYTVNYPEDENEIIEAAAKAEGDPWIGRWIRRTALARARDVTMGKRKETR